MTTSWGSQLNCLVLLFPSAVSSDSLLLALASFFPLSNITDDVGRSLGPFVSREVLALIQEQMQRLANNEDGGLLTFGVAGALWSSSAALVSIVSAVNRAYDIEEGRPWWKVRLTAIGLTLGVAAIVLGALSLVLVGPTLAETLGRTTGWGAPFEWAWLVLQWPLVFALVATGIGLIYYFGPDADQDWVWITPGAVAATILWLVTSLLLKLYVANFTDYEGSYGTVGGVIVVMLWLYLSGIAILTGAELNAEIEHASPYGKAPGQKNAQGKLLIGARAARAFQERPLPRAVEPQNPVRFDRHHQDPDSVPLWSVRSCSRGGGIGAGHPKRSASHDRYLAEPVARRASERYLRLADGTQTGDPTVSSEIIGSPDRTSAVTSMAAPRRLRARSVHRRNLLCDLDIAVGHLPADVIAGQLEGHFAVRDTHITGGGEGLDDIQRRGPALQLLREQVAD